MIFHFIRTKCLRIGLTLSSILIGVMLVVITISLADGSSQSALAAPIPPPEGYPKFLKSSMSITPTLAHLGGTVLYYQIEIRNTGAYTADGTTLVDSIPLSTTYNDDGWSSVPPMPSIVGGFLRWEGRVGFDSSVLITFSVTTSPEKTGVIRNAALITHPMISKPITLTAESMVTDDPLFAIEKSSLPIKPGANKPLTYSITLINHGQPATGLPVTVTDVIPHNTTFLNADPDGSRNGNIITWRRNVNLGLGETTSFTFSVMINDVPSGTVITNQDYRVTSPETGINYGTPYTVTVIEPIFYLSKQVYPDPPGSNREMTYTLALLNKGSLATNLVITDRVPAYVHYLRGGSYLNGVVSWSWPALDTNEVAKFNFTVYISDVMDIPLVNDLYGVCSSEGICKAGEVFTTVIGGPTFNTRAFVDPIAKKPGGGGGPVTPTLVIENVGPGNALGAIAVLQYERISVQQSDIVVIPNVGSIVPGPGCIGVKCISYIWTGNLSVGDIVTITTIDGQNSIGGEEGSIYFARVIITDTLNNTNTVPISSTAYGKVTHYSNVIPAKEAPTVIGRGQVLPYTIQIWNSGLSTDGSPWLTDTVPLSVTLMSISDGGVTYTNGNRTVISWTLPAMNPGDLLRRSFYVRVDSNLVSGTEIVNGDYSAGWRNTVSGTLVTEYNFGLPVTTTVREIGLIDSYKLVTPKLMRPGPSNVLTYFLHIVNSSEISLTGVQSYDYLPWENTTYQRDAVASAGDVISDIISVQWTGNIPALSEQVITLTVVVDPDFIGTITNTAVITHPDLLHPVWVNAVTYVTDKPVLFITKTATPDPVMMGDELLYKISVVNLGFQATNLVISDTIPGNCGYVPNSATSSGVFQNGQVIWQITTLQTGEVRNFMFRVIAGQGLEIINSYYRVTSLEGVEAVGVPVRTRLIGIVVFLPIIVQ